MSYKFNKKIAQAKRSLMNAWNTPEKLLFRKGIIPKDRYTLPDFLCIGAQKGGTTWLFRNLAKHPQIYIPSNLPHADVHYFDIYYYKSLRFYANFFLDGQDKIKGENTPAYGVLPEKEIRRIKELLPDVKILIILRNPVERAWSHARMHFFKNGNKNIDEVRPEYFFHHFKSKRSIDRGSYSKIIDIWQKYYKDQLFIGFFHDIENNPKSILHDVFSFLGVNTNVEWEEFDLTRKVNAGKQLEIPEKYRDFLLNIYSDELFKLKQEFGIEFY